LPKPARTTWQKIRPSANLVRGYGYSIMFMLSMAAADFRRPLGLLLLGSSQSPALVPQPIRSLSKLLANPQ